MASDIDTSADGSTWRLLWVAHGPELLEGLGAIDGRLLGTGSLEDVI